MIVHILYNNLHKRNEIIVERKETENKNTKEIAIMHFSCFHLYRFRFYL